MEFSLVAISGLTIYFCVHLFHICVLSVHSVLHSCVCLYTSFCVFSFHSCLCARSSFSLPLSSYLMKLPQRSHSTTMPNDSTTNVSTPQVTLISESVSIPPFTGVGAESIHQFIRRVGEECTRRNAHADAEKLAILKSRICHDPSSLAGKLVKFDQFLSLVDMMTSLRRSSHISPVTQNWALRTLSSMSLTHSLT